MHRACVFVDFIAMGRNFLPQDFVIVTRASTRLETPEIEQRIAACWSSGNGAESSPLFDGALWRYADQTVTDRNIVLTVEPTSYRVYYGTNIQNPQFFNRYGDAVMANPLIVNAFIRTIDDRYLFARRSKHVAIFRQQIHVVGGTIPRKSNQLNGDDLFGAMQEELHEEVGITEHDIKTIRCVGIWTALPCRMRQVVYAVELSISSKRIMELTQTEQWEHNEWIYVTASDDALQRFLQEYRSDISEPLQMALANGMPTMFFNG